MEGNGSGLIYLRSRNLLEETKEIHEETLVRTSGLEAEI
jgi:hypothetical protein